MKIAILTTQTGHHTWFVKKLKSFFDDIFCLVETVQKSPKFDTHHCFEVHRELYEKKFFFNNQDFQIYDICETKNVKSVNDALARQYLMHFSPDMIIVFGTGKISSYLIEKYRRKIINLHGGDPEHYRGLDSHLWAIYHEDWDNITTTLHILNEQLDDGEIIEKAKLDLSRIKAIEELRALNTEACVQLTLEALQYFIKTGTFPVKNKFPKEDIIHSCRDN